MKVIGYLSVIGLLTVSCAKKYECGEPAILKNYTGLDCCGWVIKLEDGKVIEPINLNSYVSNPVDGQEIYVSYHADSLFGCCMVGDIVQIDCLEEK
jgi:hypothetical protein